MNQEKKALGIIWKAFDFNKTAIAEAAGVNLSTVSNWFARGRVSATAAIRLEQHERLKGILTKEEMRTDIKEWFGV
jgi:hypothetical protein